MSQSKATNYEQQIPEVLQAMAGAQQAVENYGFDRRLQHLIRLRASQINGCAFCIKMHTKEAREDGESNERLDRVIVWRHVRDFDEREKAALAWIEALTQIDTSADMAALRAELCRHFTDQEVGVLTANVAMINLWNRVQVSRH